VTATVIIDVLIACSKVLPDWDCKRQRTGTLPRRHECHAVLLHHGPTLQLFILNIVLPVQKSIVRSWAKLSVPSESACQ